MTTKERSQLRIVARLACRSIETLSPQDRAALYEGLALILTDGEAEAARHNAFLIRESMRSQMSFISALDSTEVSQPKKN